MESDGLADGENRGDNEKTTMEKETDGLTAAHGLEDSTGEKESKIKIESSVKDGIIFPVDSIPPWYITLLYALQQVLSAVSGPVSASFFIQLTVCGQNDSAFLAELIGTSVFMNGFCTLLQVTFGLRLPIIQGSSWVFLPVLASLMSTPKWRCPQILPQIDVVNDTLTWNGAVDWNSSLYEEDHDEALWKPRMREVSGALIVASLFQVLLGCTGLVGVLMRFIGPLTIAPAVSLIGLSMQHLVALYCCQHWAVSLSTAAVFVLVSQLLKDVQFPFPAYSRSRGLYAVRYPVFRLFPPIFAIAFGWILCLILTMTGSLPDDPDTLGYKARTDINTNTIANNKWFFFPYPGMWGFPTFSAALMLGMLSATVCTIVESIGDYYATARACGVAAPPKHAVNRGIAMEGLGSIICGLLGAAHATTSYSQTVGFIPLTGMGSRVTWQLAGVLLMLAGIFGKFGAVLATIPEPVLGGILIVCIGMVVSVGISNLQFVDLNTGRNMMILGTSLMLGLVLPNWILKNSERIDTGNTQVDQMLTILLGAPMFVGGITGCILDNTLPGTLEERGMTKFLACSEEKKKDEYIGTSDENQDDVYSLPFTKYFSSHRWRCLSYLPFLPCYKPRSFGLRKRLPCFKTKETNKSLFD